MVTPAVDVFLWSGRYHCAVVLGTSSVAFMPSVRIFSCTDAESGADAKEWIAMHMRIMVVKRAAAGTKRDLMNGLPA
jgi:hypothetical protein